MGWKTNSPINPNPNLIIWLLLWLWSLGSSKKSSQRRFPDTLIRLAAFLWIFVGRQKMGSVRVRFKSFFTPSFKSSFLTRCCLQVPRRVEKLPWDWLSCTSKELTNNKRLNPGPNRNRNFILGLFLWLWSHGSSKSCPRGDFRTHWFVW